MKGCAAYVIGALFSTSVFANEIVIPDGSSLSLRKYDPKTHLAIFDGTIELKGTFDVAWNEDSEYADLFVTFYPDVNSMKSIPYANAEFYPKKANVILIRNHSEMLSSLIGNKLAGSIMSKQTLSVSGHASIEIHSLTTSVDCNSRSFSADLIKTKGVSIDSDNGAAMHQGGC